MLTVALVDPQIPANTGNIARLCSCTGTNLFIAGTPGFFITDKHLKRAGLDYWDELSMRQFETLDQLLSEFRHRNIYFVSTKASIAYTNVQYTPEDILVFGSETKGLEKDLIQNNMDRSIRIPMLSGKRSLNLANSVSIVLYEAIRQTNGIQDENILK